MKKYIIISLMLVFALAIVPVAFAQTDGTTTDTDGTSNTPAGGVEAGSGPEVLYVALGIILLLGGVALLVTRKPVYRQE